MRRFRITIAVALSTLLLFGISLAQQTPITTVPNLIRYDGTLKDANGAPIASAVGVTFSIYKQQDGGAAVWMETQNVTPDGSGQYGVLLGSTTATGLPSDLFSQQEQRWLGVQVQGQPEQPRVLLVSVPYAFKAVEADRLAGHSVSEFVTADSLQKAVQQQLQQQTTGVAKAGPAAANPKSAQAGQVATVTDPATNFVDSTTDQVVSVRQNGSGKAIYAAAGRTSAIVGISGADAGMYGVSTATTGQTAGIKASSSSPRGYGLVAFETATTGTGFSYGIYGTAASTLGVGIRGTATAASGTTVGIWGGSASTAGYGIKATADATSGNTVGLEVAVNSPTGTAALIQNLASGPITGMLLQAGTSAGAQFSVDGSGNVNAKGGYQIGSSSVLSIGSAADSNLFLGVGAGANNVAGSGLVNTFSGYQAGYSNTTGFSNTFSGYQAGYSNTTGDWNTFSGLLAGGSNTSGSFNTFTGLDAGYGNTTGVGNTFYGGETGEGNFTGSDNTFYGGAAGYQNNGSYNTFIGNFAGYNNTTGDQDIYIGNLGASSGTESNALRLGFPYSTDSSTCGFSQPPPCGQNVTYIAGIYGSTSSGGIPVYINANGQLGTLTSSRRFKEQVRDMGDSTNRLMKLRPVTFFYKPQYDDGSHTLQYGLIAEEVAKVYPDMVAYDKDGQPYTVKYQYLAPMLLNELQKQHVVVAAQQTVIQIQQEQIAEMQQRLSRLESLIEQTNQKPRN